MFSVSLSLELVLTLTQSFHRGYLRKERYDQSCAVNGEVDEEGMRRSWWRNDVGDAQRRVWQLGSWAL